MTRINEAGVLYTLIYGEVSSLSVNPIEKKPVFHFYPGSRWLSLGSWGCNFRCPGCQNWEIAHWRGESLGPGDFLSPSDQVETALRHGCLGISWTFNEPTLWFEYTLESARLARKKGLHTNYVTNGSITEEALGLLAPHMDVYRVDVKGFSPETYRQLAHLSDWEGILNVTERVKRSGIHVEVVTNIIPGFNDDAKQLMEMASWIRNRLGEDTPWHVTRFHPHLKLSHPMPTPVPTLERARTTGLNAGLQYVYIGNVPGHRGENTYCHKCHALLIERFVFDVLKNRIEDGCCPRCRVRIPGTF